MNFCTNCGAKREKDHQFCSQCGVDFHSPLSVSVDNPRSKPFIFTPLEKDIQTHKEHFSYQESVTRVSHYISIVLFFIIVGLGQAIATVFFGQVKPTSFSNITAFIGTMFIFILLHNSNIIRNLAHKIYKLDYPYKGWSADEVYKTLKSAQLKNGEYRCIYCGNNRLYRKGIYASESCTVNCTKCKAFLYYE